MTEEEKQQRREMWFSLHIWAAKFPQKPSPEQVVAGEEWLLAWFEQMPTTCPCRPKWLNVVRICPPPLSEGVMAVVWWAVAAHDRINVILGKTMWAEKSKRHPLILDLVEEGKPGRADFLLAFKRPAMNRF